MEEFRRSAYRAADMARACPGAPAFQIGQSVSVTKSGRGPDKFDDDALLALFAAIASRDDVGGYANA